ncbi:MAG: DUF6460 domain-containing protein [Pseudomonadota bacterium]
MLRALATLFKIGVASLLVGTGLSAFDLSAADILLQLGLTPENVLALLQQGFEWALPNVILGSMIIVPVWFLVYLFKPPSRD